MFKKFVSFLVAAIILLVSCPVVAETWNDNVPLQGNNILDDLADINENFTYLKTLLQNKYKAWDNTSAAIAKDQLYYPDPAESNQGVTASGGGDTMYDIVQALGVKYGTIYLSHHSEDGTTTTYTVSSPMTIPDNVAVIVADGATLSCQADVVFNGPVLIEANGQILINDPSGDAELVFRKPVWCLGGSRYAFNITEVPLADKDVITFYSQIVAPRVFHVFYFASDYDDVTFADGSVVYSSWFGSIETAAKKLDTVDADKVTLVIDENNTISSDTTIELPTVVRVDNGITIGVGDAITFTINAVFNAPRSEIFLLGTGSKVVFGPSSVNYVNVEWFGTDTDALANADTAAQNSTRNHVISVKSKITIASAETITSPISMLPGAQFDVDADLTLNGSVSWGGGSVPPFDVDTVATVTINGSWGYRGTDQVFTGSGTASFSNSATPYVYPEWWGIDGASDEVAINKAIDTNHNVMLTKSSYTISAPIVFDNNEDVALVGRTYKGIYNNTNPMTNIVKSSTFSGASAILLDGSVNNVKNILISSVHINGGGYIGDGIEMINTTECRVENTSVYNNAGVGLLIDGAWLTVLEDIRIKGNTSGGVLITSTSREMNHLRVQNMLSNGNSNYQMKIVESGLNNCILAQFISAHFELPADISPLVIIDSCTQLSFYGSSFTQDAGKDAATITVGSSTSTPSKIRFTDCFFQCSNTAGQAPAIDVDGVNGLAFVNCTLGSRGSGQYGLDLNGGGSISNVVVIDGLAQFNNSSGIYDPSNFIAGTYFAEGIRVGGGVDNTSIYHFSSIFNLSNNESGAKSRITTRDTGGSQHFTEFGYGTDGNLVRFYSHFPMLTAQSSAPTNPQVGTVALADRTNWDPAGIGSGGPYLVWYNGTAWVRIDQQ